MIDDPAKAIRRATLIAKGLSRTIGPLPSKDEGERVHPASMVPGVHVQAFSGGGEVQPTDETGFDAWHGTPHKFEPEPGAPLGRFRSDKIGTGEGAQAFGHGLYLGEEKTARGYRDRLKGGPGGATIFQTILQHYNNEKDIPVSASDAVQPFVGKGPEAIKNAFIQQAKKMQKSSWDSKRDDAKKIEELAADNDLHEKLNELGGHIYHVRVNANPEHFLDWDKPLSEQRHVLDRIDHHIGDPEIVMQRLFADPSKATGKDLHDAFGGKHKPEAVATKLQGMGIPGIRYLDANSRGPTGNPTHNHVIFDPSIIDIKRRYKRGGGVEGFSDGGMPGNDDPNIQKALGIARQLTPVNPLTQPQLIQGPGQELTTKSLADTFTQAITSHAALPFAQKALNSKRMGNRIATFVGRGDDGRPKPLLGQNAKLIKAGSGYEAGAGYEAQEPLELPDGRGVETTGLSLYPDSQKGKFKLCPNSASCRDACLGKTSGHYAAQYTNKPNYAVLNAQNKTKAFFEDPEAFAVRLHDEITQAKLQAQLNGNKLGVRLNTLSDVDPRVYRALIESHPDVDFYDYTKMNYDPIAPNHHYTYSSNGVTQPAGYNGSEETVFNPHSNWGQMRKRLDTGSNVAMVFNHRSQQGIPLSQFVHDEETGKKYRVVDGTTHDFRPLDRQEEGSDGVIIGLQNLQSSGTTENAHKDSKGFIVKYDPQLQMVLNKKGMPTKDAMRGPSPGVNAAGKQLLGPRIAQNDTVTIAKQPQRTQRIV